MITYSDVTMSYSNPSPKLYPRYIKNLILHPPPTPPSGTVLGISNGSRGDTENFAKHYANICYEAGP